MTTVRASIAILAAIVFGVPAAMADVATYTWKGGVGSWNDSTMWATTDAGAAGVPGEGSSVVVGDADSFIELSESVTLDGLTVSSVGKHVFRTSGPSKSCTLKVNNNNAKLAGAGGGTLVFDNITVDGKITDLANLKQLAIVGSAQVYPANSETTEILLVNGGCLVSDKDNNTFGKLILQGGPGRIYSQHGSRSFSFSALETRAGSGVSAVLVDDGKVTIRDRSTVELVGGNDTFESQGSKIPVCTQFMLPSHSSIPGVRYCHSLCTVDAEGVVRQIPSISMLDSFVGATALDNVCLTNYADLASDVTVNAVLFSGTSYNLGGHTVTVKSGQFREGESLYNCVVSNGTICLCKPNVWAETTNNSVDRFLVDFATDGVDDPLMPMLSHEAQNSEGWTFKSKYAGFTGVFSAPRGFKYFISNGSAPKAVLELRGGDLTSRSTSKKANFGGMAGDATINFRNNGQNRYDCNVWLGTMSEDDVTLVTNGTVTASVVVGNKGVFAPGLVGYDGGRRGSIRMPYDEQASNVQMLRAFLMQEGGTFMVSLNSDGTCGSLDASGTVVEDKYLSVSLAGTLSVTAAGKIALGTPYPIIKYHEGMRTGKFASVTKGFRVQYDVRQDDGSYAVVVSRKNVGTVIKLR